MRVPLTWLQEYVDVSLTPEELADRLTTVGLEVAAVHYVGIQPPANTPWTPDLQASEPPPYIPWDPEKVVVGELVEVTQHPDAERLTVPRIAYGADREISVVTGAPNIRPGMQGQKVVLALAGARLIDGHSETRRWLTLKPTKLRGVPSAGMVCSELELGLSNEHEGILLLPNDAPVGMPLVEYLGDVVLEIETTPNYAHALSILGVAREVSALTGAPLHPPQVEFEPSGPSIEQKLAVEVEDATVCPRFVAGLIEGVTVGPSPLWLQHRLRLAGMRPVNNVADVTNYVMLEYGEPSHAFDADQVAQQKLIIRQAQAGELLETLDHVKRTLRPIDTVVADPSGPLSLAGVMGGAESEISAATTSVLYEAALWNPLYIRRTAQHFKLQSEASRRFEKGVDPALPPQTARRGLQLIKQIAGGTIAQGLLDIYPEPHQLRVIELPMREVKRLLGLDLQQHEVQRLLERLHFTVQPHAGEHGPALQVTVPSHRPDVAIEADLIEEVARLYGYDRLPATLMHDELPPQHGNPEYEAIERIRDVLAASGLNEAISYSLTNPETAAALSVDQVVLPEAHWVRLANPMTPDRRVLRRDILPELLQIVVPNLREQDRVALFELGRVFHPVDGAVLPNEPRHLALVLAGTREKPSWLNPEPHVLDFFDLKGIVEELLKRLQLLQRITFKPATDNRFHPGRCADLMLGEYRLGVMGELHPMVRDTLGIPVRRVSMAELNLDALVGEMQPATYQPIYRTPATMQDIALIANEEIPAAEIEAAIWKHGGKQLEKVRLFDVYTGKPIPEGQRSLAFRLWFRSPEETLSDKALAKTREKLLKALERELGVQIRS